LELIESNYKKGNSIWWLIENNINEPESVKFAIENLITCAAPVVIQSPDKEFAEIPNRKNTPKLAAGVYRKTGICQITVRGLCNC
jgi:hypothetical protein